MFSATAWIAVLHSTVAMAASYGPVIAGPRLVPASVTRNLRSTSYTATSVLHVAESTPSEVTGVSRRSSAPRNHAPGRKRPGDDFGVSYVGSPPDSEETGIWADMVVSKLRMQAKPSLGAEPQPDRRRRPPPAPARKRPVYVPRFTTAAGGTASSNGNVRRGRGSNSRPARAKPPRYMYWKTVSYTPFPFYGFGYGPYGFGYGWKPYGPWATYG
ncbi:uncharacterized protein [Dermacentor albipictus]|uniref:uncharacterized protein isoform X2 n=1 Tax=Dermacentor albipictus TaxID=60249 RepID=UPI0031FD116E